MSNHMATWNTTSQVVLQLLFSTELPMCKLASYVPGSRALRSLRSLGEEKTLIHDQYAQCMVMIISPDNQTLTLEKKAVDDFKAIDPTSLLSDSLLLRIFSLLPSSQYLPNSLVCKRWLALHGRLRRSLKLLDSSSFTSRFSDLTEIDLIAASVHSQSPRSSSYIFLTLPIHSDDSAARFVLDELFLPPDYIDIGLRTLSSGCPNLWKLTLIAETKAGLASIAAECPTLQELELHRCTNDVLSTIASFENLQILRVIAFVEGLYDDSSISDVGLTILAHDCRCLVKLELSGCEGSYEGISAIGPCCPMLEELTLCDHWMDGGWLAPLSFCGNLKTLRLEGCKKVDANPGQVEHLGLCLALKTLQLRRCQLQDKESLSTLFIVCATVREIIFQNFWGLDNDMFSIASICRSYYQIGFEADGSKGVDIVPFEEPFAGTSGGVASDGESILREKILRLSHLVEKKDTEVTRLRASLSAERERRGENEAIIEALAESHEAKARSKRDRVFAERVASAAHADELRAGLKSFEVPIQSGAIIASIPTPLSLGEEKTLIHYQYAQCMDRMVQHHEEVVASKNKANRSKQTLKHTGGTKSFARHRDEETRSRTDGSIPSRADLFIRTHSQKDETPVDEKSAEIISKFTELSATQGGSSSSIGIQGQLLEVTVVGCTNLKNTEWISRQDPYVHVEYALNMQTQSFAPGPVHASSFHYTIH
ncbi:hypothetical protein AAC387_Pa05g0694 [Persea americana]